MFNINYICQQDINEDIANPNSTILDTCIFTVSKLHSYISNRTSTYLRLCLVAIMKGY